MLRTVLVGLAAISAAVLSVRAAAVQAFADQRVDLAAKFWRSHPQVAAQLDMAAIGRAAARGHSPDAGTAQRVRALLGSDPLAAEPFTVEGTAALSEGREQQAERLLKEGIRRDPRAPAPRYLLADLDLRHGRTAAGLQHIAVLARRLPRAADALLPSIAAFARQPGAAVQLQPLLAGNPELRGRVLDGLAQDPSNAALVLRLAGERPGDAVTASWAPRLLASLIRAQQYGQAYQVWAKLSGVDADKAPLLFNADVDRPPALPPFDWSLAAGSSGIAERAKGGGLRVLFYGRDDAELASQMLLLPPGRYRFAVSASGSSDARSSLEWRVRCLPGGARLAQTSLEEVSGTSFVVPASCKAQALELRGLPSEDRPASEVLIRNMSLRAVTL